MTPTYALTESGLRIAGPRTVLTRDHFPRLRREGQFPYLIPASVGFWVGLAANPVEAKRLEAEAKSEHRERLTGIQSMIDERVRTGAAGIGR